MSTGFEKAADELGGKVVLSIVTAANLKEIRNTFGVDISFVPAFELYK